jgi:hypothetical protein
MRRKLCWASSVLWVWLWGCGAVELEEMKAPSLWVAAPHPTLTYVKQVLITVSEPRAPWI